MSGDDEKPKRTEPRPGAYNSTTGLDLRCVVDPGGGRPVAGKHAWRPRQR